MARLQPAVARPWGGWRGSPAPARPSESGCRAPRAARSARDPRGRVRADHHALAAQAVPRLDDQLVHARERALADLGVAQVVGRHRLDQRAPRRGRSAPCPRRRHARACRRRRRAPNGLTTASVPARTGPSSRSATQVGRAVRVAQPVHVGPAVDHVNVPARRPSTRAWSRSPRWLRSPRQHQRQVQPAGDLAVLVPGAVGLARRRASRSPARRRPSGAAAARAAASRSKAVLGSRRPAGSSPGRWAASAARAAAT